MRKRTVERSLAESGFGDGNSSSETGISTSMVPTLKGPVYSGKLGVGFRDLM